jgi:serine palmitoyltransferase
VLVPHTDILVFDMSSSSDVVSTLSQILATVEHTFYKIPGSSVVARYVKSSHRDDPGRTILEILLALFVIRTWLQSRTRTESAGKHFVQFSEKVCATANSHCTNSDTRR